MLNVTGQLAQNGFAHVPHFLRSGLVAELNKDFSLANFQRATLGRERLVSDEIRRDEISWLAEQGKNPAQVELLTLLAELKNNLNQDLYLGLTNFEGHYAHYPAGGFYRRHLDCPRGTSKRVVSVIIYLNQSWNTSDGGRLRLHHGPAPVDIAPIGGTLVCFLSQKIEHEVLESFAPRKSFTGWFLRSS